MDTNYGKKTTPPAQLIAESFGSRKKPVLLKGGQCTTYISGNIVLKPVGRAESLIWKAEVFNNLPEVSVSGVRFTKYIKSIYNTWIHEGYSACFFLAGKHVSGKYKEKLKASREYHKLLKNIKKPSFLDVPGGPWSTANKVALGEKEFDYDQDFFDLYNQIKPHLEPLDINKQLIHADLSGNFLFDEILPPAIIDFSPAWAPNGFAEAIMLADAIVWENADYKDLEVFKKVPNIGKLAWRGILTRIVEQAEHIKWFDKDRALAVKDARAFQKAIDYLKVNY